MQEHGLTILYPKTSEKIDFFSFGKPALGRFRPYWSQGINKGQLLLIQVMIEVNNFSMKKQWVTNTPTIIYALIVGALSDDFGRKPLISVPLFGSCLLYTSDAADE